jgi:beta-glucuronidase
MGGFNDGLLIGHNTISNVPYSGISVGWGWNYEGLDDTQRNIRILANRISNFMLELYDGGAIYTQAQSPGSLIDENYIDFSGTNHGNGIYLDERSRKFEVCGNVVWNINKKPAVAEGQWVSAWSSWSGDLNIHDNWSDDLHTKLHNPGKTKLFHDNHLALDKLTPEAERVIANSGSNGSGDASITSCKRDREIR